ncbi:hypothetical protein OBBRIDRAFT_794877 [Obba rivulosa]|uniref:Uncharacterized protein n=1 Tax=Obba rivulosa TaxID=1052685 RepID=A0A8E2AR56_9APHY|nr:hypothetical protein OBBRIDRAFT_794877 [Obba rivulosa]
MPAREWEEDHVRLDQAWYTGVEEGGAGDDEFNPLAQEEDLGAIREAQAATKQVKKVLACQAQSLRNVSARK